MGQQDLAYEVNYDEPAGSRKTWPSWMLEPPPEGHPGVGKWVWNKYQIMRRHRDRQGLPEVWSRNHKLYRGNFFRTRAGKYSYVLANLVFKLVNAFKANLTDNKPRCSIMPRGDTDDNIARMWQACYDAWWDNTRQQYELQESVGRSELYGYTVSMMVYDPDYDGGEILTKRIDTFGFLAWPGCLDIQSSPMVCVIEAMDLGEIYRLWPHAEGKVKPEPEYSEILQKDSTAFVRATTNRQLRPIGGPADFVVPEGRTGEGADDRDVGLQRALIVKMWCRDYSTIWVNPETGEEVPNKPIIKEVFDNATGIKIATEILAPEEIYKYPGNIRYIVVANQGNLVLEDRPNPSINPELPRELACQTYLWDKFPFIKRFSYSDDTSEYGLSFVEQIETLVKEVSKKLTIYGLHIDTQCRSPLILPQNCGVKQDQINNLPGLILHPIASMSQYIRFLDVPPAPSDALKFIETCIMLIDMVTGIVDVSEGRKPSGIQSGVAIATLQEKAQVIFREKIRHLDLYLEEQARMFLSLAQNYYTEVKKVKYAALDGTTRSIEMRGPDFIHEMSVRIEAGSTLPRSRAAKQAVYMDLARLGKISDKSLLKELEVPNYENEALYLEQGPINMALDKLRRTGMFDEATLEAIHRIINMDEKTFNAKFGAPV